MSEYFTRCASYAAKERRDSRYPAVLGLTGVRPGLCMMTSPVAPQVTVEGPIPQVSVVLNVPEKTLADDPGRQPLSHTPSHNGSEMDDLDDDDSSYTIELSGKHRKSKQST